MAHANVVRDTRDCTVRRNVHPVPTDVTVPASAIVLMVAPVTMRMGPAIVLPDGLGNPVKMNVRITLLV
jgi:hypothetical protein